MIDSWDISWSKDEGLYFSTLRQPSMVCTANGLKPIVPWQVGCCVGLPLGFRRRCKVGGSVHTDDEAELSVQEE